MARTAPPRDKPESTPGGSAFARSADHNPGIKVRFLLDEHISPAIKAGLLRRQPALDVLCLGDPGAPPLGTPDPDILRFLETTRCALVTMNRRSMWQHVADHWQAGGHHWGLFWTRRNMGYGELIRQLLLIWEASEAEDWRDQMNDFPL